jgi:uncharacterized protein (DUF58 family)
MRLRSLSKYLKPPRGFRLTKPGKIFFGFLFCLIVIAMITGNNLLYLVLAGMMAFMIVSGIESELNLRYLEINRLLPSEIFAGMPIKMGYLIRNPRNESDRLVLKDISQVRVEKLQRRETQVLYTDVTLPRRGKVHLGTITILTTYPYGLFEKSITFPTARDVLVFPEPLLCNPSLTSGPYDSGGGKAKDSISHVRPYVPGDPLSMVVWKKQRHGLISRVFEGGAGMSGVVVLIPGPDLEQKLSWATYLISELYRMGNPFGLVLNGLYSGIASSRAHKIDIFIHLALAQEIHQPSPEVIPKDARIIYI